MPRFERFVQSMCMRYHGLMLPNRCSPFTQSSATSPAALGGQELTDQGAKIEVDEQREEADAREAKAGTRGRGQP